MPIGFNQAWFENSYGHQFMDKSYNPKEIERIFALAKQANAHSLRLWLFESSDFSMIHFKDNSPAALKNEYIQNIIQTLEIAKKYQVKVYATIFDAHQFNPLNKPAKQLIRFRSLFNSINGDLFIKNVMIPLLESIKENDLQNQIDKIDLINEGDTMVNRFAFNQGWNGVKKFICNWKNQIQGVHGFEKLPVTLSVRLHPLLSLPRDFLNNSGPMQCADFIDFHSYNDAGNINRCRWIKDFADKKLKKIILGEFGQGYFNKTYSDQLQVKNTQNYIKNAQSCGFSEAFAWRLSDIRQGHNKEARYSFESFGTPRPAFYVIRDFNNQ